MEDEDEIVALTAAYRSAVGDKDPGRLSALYANEVRVFDTWGQRPFEGLEAWRTNLEGWLTSLGAGEGVQVAFDEVQISRRGAMACLNARVTYRAVNDAGQVLRWMHNRLSWVVVKADDGWAIIHEHTSVPIGPDLKGHLKDE